MKANHSEIICILDRSGSMSSMCSDAIGGFNTFLKTQQAQEGTADLTLVLFDHEYQKPIDKIAIQDVPLLDEKSYVPRGSTALYDAIGKSIDEVGMRLSQTAVSERPEQVIVAILTDGYENSSRVYNQNDIAFRIKHQSEVYAWEFVFLAAGQDAIETASSMNIAVDKAYDFAAKGENLQHSFVVISEEVKYSRSKTKFASMSKAAQKTEEDKHSANMQKMRDKLKS